MAQARWLGRAATGFIVRPMRAVSLGLLLGLLLAACGGGGGSSPQAVPAPGVNQPSTSAAPDIPVIAPPGLTETQASVLVGAVVKGPVGGATVCAYEIKSGAQGSRLACTTTDLQGHYRLVLDHEGEVAVEATGGTYEDEATGQVLPLATPFRSIGRVARAGTATVVVTPFTHIGYRLLAGALSVRGFEDSLAGLGGPFGLDQTMDLAGTLPVVAAGGDNAYGAALRLLSQAMANGATLDGLFGSLNRTVTHDGLRRSRWCTAAADGHLKNWSLLVTANIQNGMPANMQPLVIDVTGPSPNWRAELSSGTYARCEVTANTELQVRLICPVSIVQGTPPNTWTSPNAYGGIRLYAAGSAASYVAPVTPNSSILQAAGERISMSGGPVWLGYDSNIYFAAIDGIIDAGSAVLTTNGTKTFYSPSVIRTPVATACAVDAAGAPMPGSASAGGLLVSR